jgi:hypothetical protein
MARAHRSVLSTWVSRVCRPCPLGPPRRMNTPGTAHPSKRHRSPAELIRQWCGTFGPSSATYRRRPRPGDTWHRGEAFRPSNGPRHARWRAGDQGGKGLEALGPRRRDAEAAQQSFRQSLNRCRGCTTSRGAALLASRAMGLRGEQCCPAWTIASPATSLIGPNILTGRRVSGNVPGGGAALRGRPGASWRRTGRAWHTPAPDGDPLVGTGTPGS